jgi:hypothetical protein
MKRSCQSSRLAFATVMAIILLGLVTTALAALMVVARNDYRRTTATTTEAQLRQLLLAATMESTARASNWGDAPKPAQWTLDAPAGAGSARLQLAPDSKDRVTIGVTASVGKRHLMQTQRYNLTASKWQLVEVQISSGQ